MGDGEKTKEQRIEDLEQALEGARESLRECEERILIYSQLSNDIFFSYDSALKVTSVTPNVERIAGYDPAELVGRNFTDLQFIVHPGDIDEAMETADHLLSGKTDYPNIYRFFTKDGQQRFAEAAGVPIFKDGRVVAMVSRASDITRHVEMERSLKESEENCLRILQALPDAVCIIRSEDFRVLYVNECFSRITGYSREEALGRVLFDLRLAPDTMDNEVFAKACRDRRELSRREYRCRKRDGTYVDVIASCKIMHHGDSEAMAIFMTDVSSLREILGRREDREGRSLQKEKLDAVRTLAAGIAHDFNNILTAILGYVRMASRDVSDETDVTVVREELNEVRRAALKARDLVNQLLAFSSHGHCRFAPIVLRDAVREALKMLQSILPVNVEVQASLDDDGFVLGDPILIHQAVMNLCTNAVHAMAGHGGVLSLSIEKVLIDDAAAPDPDLSAGPYLRFRVHDTGPGMNHTVQTRVFEPYFSTRWKGRGSGLGLSVVHGIIRDHGGAVTCTSRAGEGTVFDLYLPEISAEAVDLDALVEVANARGHETILIIDDEATVVNPVNRTLESLGYTVVTRRRGADALDHFRKNPAKYDLVITDMGRTDMEGEVLAQRLAEIRADIPVIVCGATDSPLPGGTMKAPGLRECILRPSELKHIARTVRKVLDRERHLAGED